MQIPSELDMMNAGVHFGHRATRWHPKARSYIFGERQGIHVINLDVTAEKLAAAADVARALAAEGKTILFLGTKRQAQAVVRAEAERCGMPFLTAGWIGGLITNFEEIGKLLERYRTMKQERENGGWEKYLKKERVRMEDDFVKKDAVLSGLISLKRVPDAVYLVDVRQEKTAVREAQTRGITTIAMTDTNVNPELVTHAIPSNDDAVKAIALVTKIIADAIIEGRAQRPVEAAPKIKAPVIADAPIAQG
ncbi:30S ribosomal protein S2 [Candidatus Berkelbacteria bacterium]|nr:30S ribosomal protein S2 [Candidatus Berkelbacteria bacterium]